MNSTISRLTIIYLLINSFYCSAQYIQPINNVDDETKQMCRPPIFTQGLKDDNTKIHSKDNDITPPSTPVITNTHLFSWYSSYIEFSPSTDSESGIANYVYSVGTQPGLADLEWWTTLNVNTLKTPSVSLWTLNILENQTFYITIYAKNGDGLSSQYVHSQALSFNWQNLGDVSNTLNYEFGTFGLTSNGEITTTFSNEEVTIYTHFMQRIIPIIKEIYGSPSHTYTVRLVRDLYYNSSNIFFPGSNEIHIGTGTQLNPLLLTHELIHAFRDDVILAVDSLWIYNTKLSAFEESFAEGIAYACMNRYIELYPHDVIVHPDGDKVYNPICESYYDMLNRSHLTTEDYWSDGNGMLLCYERYQMGASALLKMKIENNNFASLFNQNYYSQLNNNHLHINTRESITSGFSNVINEVEGRQTIDWLNAQRIFDCQIKPGRKIYLNTDYYPTWFVNLIFQRINFAETFPNGSEWYYAGQYHHLNGASGSYNLFNYNQVSVVNGNFTTAPAGQPFSGLNEYNGFATKYLALSTNQDASPWPGGNASDFLFNIDEFGLYNFQVTIDTVTENYPRIIGDQLINHSGIYGGIQHARGGNISFKHAISQNFDTIPIQKGAFLGTNNWSAVFNSEYGRGSTVPGKVEIRYRDSICELFTDRRNVIYGDRNNGVEVFLFDTEKMIHNSFNLDFSISNSGNTYNFDELTLDAEYWSWDFGDGTISNEQNPIHTYIDDNQNYNVCLTTGRFNECETKICKLTSTSQLDEKYLNATLLPNPITNGTQTIVLDNVYKQIEVSIFNLQGQQLGKYVFNSTDTLNIDFSLYAEGFYSVKVKVDGFTSLLKTIKL